MFLKYLRRCMLLTILSAKIHHGLCADRNDAKNLRTKLFVTDGYDKRIRPSNNQSDPIVEYVNLYLLSINELSETTETLKTTGYLWLLWHDEFLQWTPEDYGGLKYYHWPQVFHSTCAIDITYFPFDVQECKLEFVAWSYTKNEVTMISGEKGIVIEGFETNSEWDVIDTNYTVDWDSGEASVIFSVKIKRKPLYVLLSVIMPIIMLSILNISVFVLPCDSGEKASYSITVFLAFAVFLSIISATFPENSEAIALFSIYLIVLTLQSTVITLIALVLARCASFDADDTPVPRWLRCLLTAVSCQCCCRRRTRKNQESVISPYNTWKNVVNKLDIVFFVFFTLVLVVSTLVFFTATRSI
ncbi:acetylcholine receptor subunit beta-type unc-29-like [Mercenaria mercenaria]|uniref:acetylcholine receptor subunit beta-type unc-29-like n=1 Tax=Mercenaria mercenaria TaxID=6596 RepID=UPI00234F3618|nr:acetylcholine receptor subunit beta-type unc-29-like [Mercenaria mercenaria]XP_053399142.1 acetylcholine receptor subunit beta-type unc-29-like [Mercenaria mercenaria]XP_053399143.1 acetylcholine receptor subunit beta-type unc-29-like [Mercenaria mercenaria]